MARTYTAAMKNPALALGLLLLLAPVASATAAETPPSLDVRARVADPREVVIAFADLCLMAANDAAEDAAVKARGGTPIAETPPQGAPPGRHYDFAVSGVPARVGFGNNNGVCMLDVVATDVPATLAMFEDFLTDVFSSMGRAEANDGRPPPPGGRTVRDVHLAKPGDPFGFRLTLIAVDRPGAPSNLILFRFFEQPNARAQAALAAPAAPVAPPPPPPALAAGADYAPSEDISARANFPPVYPEAAFKACAFGVVRVLVSIDAQGNVLDVTINRSSRNRDLDRAAMDAARQWKFNPGQVDGQPVGGDIIVPVNFQDPCPAQAEPAQ